MATIKKTKKAEEAKTVTCGDCDRVWPEGTEKCPECGYEIED